MTTPFNPPPEYDAPHAGVYGTGHRSARWSKSAVAGFVFSLLGCLGVTALLGLIFGIVGVANTSGGRRQGRALAVAAIPISLVLGALSVLGMMVLAISATLTKMPDHLEAALQSEAMTSGRATEILRELGSQKFNQTVSDADLDAWYAQLNAKHGRLVKVLPPENEAVLQKAPGEPLRVVLKGRFGNDMANITITTHTESRFGPIRIHDIEIGGLSPHRVSAEPGQASPDNGE